MPKGQKINNGGYKKATKAEKEQRIEDSMQWVLQNPDAKWTDFVIYACNEWDIQKDQANKYLKYANEKLGNIETNVEAARRVAELSLKNLLRDAQAEGDVKLALQIRQEINKISGLYTQRIQVEDVSEQPIFNTTPIKASEQDEQD